jgi:hypothetical protein
LVLLDYNKILDGVKKVMKRSYLELHSLSMFDGPSVDKVWLSLILCVDDDLTRSLDIESPIRNRALETLTTWASMIMPKGNVWPAVHPDPKK